MIKQEQTRGLTGKWIDVEGQQQQQQLEKGGVEQPTATAAGHTATVVRKQRGRPRKGFEKPHNRGQINPPVWLDLGVLLPIEGGGQQHEQNIRQQYKVNRVTSTSKFVYFCCANRPNRRIFCRFTMRWCKWSGMLQQSCQHKQKCQEEEENPEQRLIIKEQQLDQAEDEIEKEEGKPDILEVWEVNILPVDGEWKSVPVDGALTIKKIVSDFQMDRVEKGPSTKMYFVCRHLQQGCRRQMLWRMEDGTLWSKFEHSCHR